MLNGVAPHPVPLPVGARASAGLLGGAVPSRRGRPPRPSPPGERVAEGRVRGPATRRHRRGAGGARRDGGGRPSGGSVGFLSKILSRNARTAHVIC